MAFVLSVMTMSFCSLWLQFGSCAPAPPMLPSAISSGHVLATLDPFTNSDNNISLSLFLRSDNYLSLAALRRSQLHRYDINTTADFCEIDVETVGVWNWRSGCAQISLHNTCSAALSKEGDLQVLDGSSVVWSSHTAGKNVQSVEILESGELVFLNSSNAIVWRSSENIVTEECVNAEAPTTTSSPSPQGPDTQLPSSSSPSSTSEEASKGSEGPSQAPNSSASRLSVPPLRNSLTSSQITAVFLSGGCAILIQLLLT